MRLTVEEPARAAVSLGRASAGVIAVRIVGKGTRFALMAVTARILGASGFGAFSLALVFGEVMGKLGNAGAPNALVRIFPQVSISVRKRLFVRSVLLTVVLSVVAGVAVYLGADVLSVSVFHDAPFAPILRLLGLALPLVACFYLSSRAARAVRRADIEALVIDVLQPLVHLAAIGALYLWSGGLTPIGAVTAWVFATVLASAPAWASTVRGFDSLAPGREQQFSGFERFALPFVLIELSTLILTKTDRVMLGAIETMEAVGWYSAAAMFSMQLPIFLNSMNAVLAPRMATAYATGDMESVDEEFRAVAHWSALLTLPPALFALALPREMLTLIGGADYGVAAGCLIALVIGQLLNVATGSVGFLLSMSGREVMELSNTIATGLLNVGLNLVLIPPLGILGAATATALSIGVVNIVRLAQVWRIYGITPFSRRYLNTWLAASCAIGMWYLLPLPSLPAIWEIVVGGAILMALFAGALLAFGERAALTYVFNRYRPKNSSAS